MCHIITNITRLSTIYDWFFQLTNIYDVYYNVFVFYYDTYLINWRQKWINGFILLKKDALKTRHY